MKLLRRVAATIVLLTMLAVSAPLAFAATAPTNSAPMVTQAAKTFANCTALNKVYRHGVGKPRARDHVSGSAKPVTNFKVSLALYTANKGKDRDHDGIACEKH